MSQTTNSVGQYRIARESDGALRFAVSDGQLPTDQQLYVFVFDDQNQANQQGYPISLSAEVRAQ